MPDFVASAHEHTELPPDVGCEIAFAGRSNAGKSSAINAITARRKLAFVSKTPGRTQTINFFGLGQNRRLVDLPGYGYASVPQTERAHWANLISALPAAARLARGTRVDRRRASRTEEPGPATRRLVCAVRTTAIRLLTKADKLTQRDAHANLERARGRPARIYPPRCSPALFGHARDGGSSRAEDSARLAEIKSPRLKGSKTGGKKP